VHRSGALHVHAEQTTRPPDRLAALRPLRARPLDAGARALHEPAKLLLGDPGEDRQQQVSHRPAGVEPRFSYADERHARVVESQGVVHVARHRPPEAIERPHEQHLESAASRVSHHSVKRWAAPRGARVLRVRRHDHEAASLRDPLQLRALVVDGLLVCAYPQVNCRVLGHATANVRS
jgi:hypothetical protein